jgi:uncharacterized DUF497 family protein
MDIEFTRHGIRFVANRDKAQNNLRKHGVSFEQAAEAFFDPFLKIIDASRQDETRDAMIGCDDAGRLLFVVHLLFADDYIRLVSALRATREERQFYENE